MVNMRTSNTATIIIEQKNIYAPIYIVHNNLKYTNTTKQKTKDEEKTFTLC